jgi:hypothetical protein
VTVRSMLPTNASSNERTLAGNRLMSILSGVRLLPKSSKTGLQ